MVALSFKRQFGEAIVTRRKSHTLRNMRKRPIAVGEKLQMFVGMRTKECRRLGEGVCDRLKIVHLDFTMAAHARITVDDIEVDPLKFAQSDGFENVRAMVEFWKKEHGTVYWHGQLIGWRDFVPEPIA